jgi:cytochrome b pre-mRNA-processing protein 3
MILNLFWRPPPRDSIVALYGAIVAQARHPAFYRDYAVPDTVNGRFEMVVLHAALLLGRLEAGGEGTRRLGQAVFDHFCSDMDANLREMGVGDIAVPRKMKAIGEAFYGRKRAYETAMAVPDSDQLPLALMRNVGTSSVGAERLAAYVRDTARRLAALDGAELSQGAAAFPDPLASPQASAGTTGGA